MEQVRELIDVLTDAELAQLVMQGGVADGESYERDVYEGLIDEIDREDFYRIYRQLMAARQ